MIKNPDVIPDADMLRQRAEQRLDNKPVLDTAAEADARKLLHELQVHQIELEMQNEALRQARTDAETALQQYTELYDFSPVGHFTLGRDGIVRQVNLAGAALLGLVRSTLTGRRLGDLVEGKDRVAFAAFLERIFAARTREIGELSLSSQGIAPRFVHIEGIADATGESCRVVVMDITERKQFEHALQENNLELERAKAAAEKANLAKSEFLSKMSHELRTPLNAVLGFAQLMAAGKPPPTAAQILSIDQILEAGWYLLRLINEILDLAMIESGKVTMSQEAIALTDMLQDCEAMITPQALKHEIALTFPCFDRPCYVHADRTRLKQVMINLLSNAIKYNRAGGTVTVQCDMSGEHRVRISIHDTGAGLTPEQVAQLFQPFNRLGQDARAEQGTGIGLVVTKQLLELMGGVIGVESHVGGGSVFWIELAASSAPVLMASNSGARSVEQRVHLAPHVSSSPRTLLYVEDNPANLALVEQLIARRNDLTLLTAIDRHLGIQLARVHQPDVILMDINLPGISGFGALKVLHEDPATAHIPIMALSANAMERDILRGLEAGFFRYLTKPIKVDEFMDALDTALHRAAAHGLESKAETLP